MGDLYPRWVGTRALLLQGQNPYGVEVSHEIQMAFYGHAIEQRYDKPESEILDEQRFAYPVYVVFLLAPIMHVDFARVQAWAPWILACLTAISIWLWLRTLRWRPAWPVAIAILLWVVSSPQIAQGLRLRQLGLLVAFLLALASWCVTRQHYFVAGVLLAISTIKPQMMVLCLVWFLLWTMGEWKQRWPLAAGFGATLAVLAGTGELLLPGWLRFFVEGLEAYRKYFPTTSLLRLFLGNWTGGILSILGVAALLAFAWNKRKVGADSEEFLRVLSLFFIATTLILPLLTPFNQVLLLLPLLTLVRDWGKLPGLFRACVAGVGVWPAAACLALWVHPPQADSLSHWPMVVFAVPFLVALLAIARPQAAA